MEIGRKLAEENPATYLPNVARTLINLGIFYQIAVKNREASIDCLIEAVIIILPVVENVPYTQKYLQTAADCLQDWGLSEEDVEQLIAQKLPDEKD